ncbi:hypothetical protein [Xanthomonas prunicola]|uniref:Lipoprotein n=1 Tax=Xanthomonas prunicola TaxID=2053930 RepID=A0A2N3RDM0_9XANT|nr:hypothetical protein [Xanthomonas prunicola]PKV10590.1 hypothetical protein XpruCFBP8353_22615 [Xanthomonas prunicola]PKV19101.1 hypothetical protein CVO74_22790 [Xanthomonas prunicola]
MPSKSKFFYLLVSVAVLLGACESEAPSQKVSANFRERKTEAQQPEVKSMPQVDELQGLRQMTPLHQVVSLLVTQDNAPWSSFDGASKVHWREASPQSNPDSNSPENFRFREGTLLLDGFGMVDVSDGNQGAEAGVKKVNEGESGITLSGDSQNVHSIAVKKFYVSPDYTDVVKRQLPSATSLRLIAGDCAADLGEDVPDTQTKFFEVVLDGHQLFLEAYVDDGEGSRGPGYTTFLFTKEKPKKKIEELQCKAR